MKEPNIEVEVKVPLTDLHSLEKSFQFRGYHILNSETQYDEYYDHPCKSFKETDEAVRLRRRVPVGTKRSTRGESRQILELTYKGPRVDSKSKSRIEVSLVVDDSESAKLFLERLGFKYVTTIIKKRVFYKVGDATASLDDVEGVGLFLEIEKIVASGGEVEKTRDELLRLMSSLGLDPSASIRDSYLELYQRKVGQGSSA
jgi:adenylate cyclase class 2